DDTGHQFDPGFSFHAPGWYRASAFDPADSGVRADVMVEVLSQGSVRIVQDAVLRADPGTDYQYNDAGTVTAVSTDPLTFSSCGGPSGFNVDSSGKVTWFVPADKA